MKMKMTMRAGAVMEKGLLILLVLILLMMPASVYSSASEFGGRKLMSSSHEWRETEEAVASVDYSLDPRSTNSSPPPPKPNTHNPLPLAKRIRS